jgi:hypothetical protein
MILQKIPLPAERGGGVLIARKSVLFFVCGCAIGAAFPLFLFWQSRAGASGLSLAVADAMHAKLRQRCIASGYDLGYLGHLGIAATRGAELPGESGVWVVVDRPEKGELQRKFLMFRVASAGGTAGSLRIRVDGQDVWLDVFWLHGAKTIDDPIPPIGLSARQLLTRN